MDLGLRDKRAIVTGGSLGIGKAIARELAAETGRRVIPLVADVTSRAQLGRHGITVNCIHPGITRTERTPRLLAARATELGIAPDDVEKRDFADDSPRGNASDKAWAVTGELVVASGGAGRSVYY